MAAGLTDHIWSFSELLTYQVAPQPWAEPKRRTRAGRRSQVRPAGPKRPRGRPRKHPLPEQELPKRPRGLPHTVAWARSPVSAAVPIFGAALRKFGRPIFCSARQSLAVAQYGI